MREQLDSLKRKLSEANENRETMESLRHQLAEKSQEMESALEEAAALKVKLEKTEASTVRQALLGETQLMGGSCGQEELANTQKRLHKIE
jgi:ribosomal protein L9